MATDTKLESLIINELTQEQYDALETKDPNQIYVTPSTAGAGLPDQTSHSGVLQTNGTTASWNDNIKVNSTSILLTDTAQPAVNGQIVIGNGAGGPGNSGVDNVIVGDRATAANYGIALGADAKATAESSVQIGAGTNSEAGTVCFATGTYPNQKNVKLLNNQGFVPANALADGGTVGQVLSITATGLAWTNGSGGGSDNNGLEGDYATRYGISDETKSGLPYIKAVGSKTVVFPAEMVLDIPGVSGLTTLTSDIEYEVQSTDNPELFLLDTPINGSRIIESTDVFFSETEPDNGASTFAAWWDGSGVFKLKSNDTGNVWRPANAVRIAKTVFTDTSLTRLCFTGCRVLNKQEYLANKGGVGKNNIWIGDNITAVGGNTTNSIQLGNGTPTQNLFKVGDQAVINMATGRLFPGLLGDRVNEPGVYHLELTVDEEGAISPTKWSKEILPAFPTEEGNYTLKLSVDAEGNSTTEWVAE